MRIERHLCEIAGRAVAETTGVDQDPLLRPTQDDKLGDYQINAAMALAKRLGKKPREVAEPLAEAIATDACIASAEVAGPGFVNLRLDDGWLAARLTEDSLDRDRDGVPPTDAPETVVVDFSSPNIAKQMHVGHLRSTIIGDAICRTLRFAGHRVIGDNHLGDWGTQFGLLIVGMREWGDEAALEREPIVELERVYKLASARAKEDDSFAESARRELAKLQGGDADNRALWTRFVKTTRGALDRVYDRLGVRFDEWLGESAYDDMLPGVVEALLERGIAREDQGAICVFFDQRTEDVVPKELRKQKEPFIVRKKDGAFLYSTSDIATVLHRRDHFHADRAIYVVDSGQSLHFKQLFAVVRLLGVDMALQHVGFGVVLRGGKRLSTRDAEGRPITLESLLDEAERRAEERIRAEGLRVAPADVPDVARMVGIGAVKWADLRQNRTSDYEFEWDRMVSFNGYAGPYMQYAYARTQSIFREGDVTASAQQSPIALGAPQERALGMRLLRFADVLEQVERTLCPHFLCEHLYALAQAFSSFYEHCPVLKSEGATRESRLSLVDLTGRQLRRGLDLLGIEAPERM
jgi:arginyl-tRNA synthetase